MQSEAMTQDTPNTQDSDPTETQEWLDALDAVIAREGPERAHFLLETLIDKSRRSGAYIPFRPHTAYVNTIPPHAEAPAPGDHALEWKIRSLTRWNAMAMVIQANRAHDGIGGHAADDQGQNRGYDRYDQRITQAGLNRSEVARAISAYTSGLFIGEFFCV